MGITLSKQHDPWKRIIIPRRMLKVKFVLSCNVYCSCRMDDGSNKEGIFLRIIVCVACKTTAFFSWHSRHNIETFDGSWTVIHQQLSNTVFPNLFLEISTITHNKLLVQKTLGDCLLPSSGNLVEGSRKENLQVSLESRFKRLFESNQSANMFLERRVIMAFISQRKCALNLNFVTC